MADTDFGYVDGAPGKVKALSLATPQPTERRRIGDEIKAASIFARAYVNRNPRAIVMVHRAGIEPAIKRLFHR